MHVVKGTTVLFGIWGRCLSLPDTQQGLYVAVQWSTAVSVPITIHSPSVLTKSTQHSPGLAFVLCSFCCFSRQRCMHWVHVWYIVKRLLSLELCVCAATKSLIRSSCRIQEQQIFIAYLMASLPANRSGYHIKGMTAYRFHILWTSWWSKYYNPNHYLKDILNSVYFKSYYCSLYYYLPHHLIWLSFHLC